MHSGLLAAAPAAPVMTYGHAVAIGLLQGVTELFPISSLGHSVLLPSLLGWKDVGSQSAESPFLAFLVGLHVATAAALFAFFWRDWLAIIQGLFRSAAKRRIDTPAERLGWLLVAATIPAGVTGLLLEHTFRTVFAKPLAAAAFLIVNGVILLAGERLRRLDSVRALATAPAASSGVSAASAPAAPRRGDDEPGRRLDTLGFTEAVLIGVAQIGALLAGISRAGITMTAGLVRGLDHEDAARFSFLLATPIIGAAGLYKVPDLLGPLGAHIRGQVIAGSVAAAAAAFVAVKFLVKYFESRTLTPFAIYCIVAGAACAVRFGFF